MSFLGRDNTKCKGNGAGTSLVCSGNKNQTGQQERVSTKGAENYKFKDIGKSKVMWTLEVIGRSSDLDFIPDLGDDEQESFQQGDERQDCFLFCLLFLDYTGYRWRMDYYGTKVEAALCLA